MSKMKRGSLPTAQRLAREAFKKSRRKPPLPTAQHQAREAFKDSEQAARVRAIRARVAAQSGGRATPGDRSKKKLERHWINKHHGL